MAVWIDTLRSLIGDGIGGDELKSRLAESERHGAHVVELYGLFSRQGPTTELPPQMAA